MADQPPVHSPLEGWTSVFAGLPDAVTLAEVPYLSQLDVRVEPDSAAAAAVGKALGGELPGACSASRLDGVDVLWLGPDEWLVVAGPGRQAELDALLRQAIGAEHGAVVDVSAQRTALRLSGPGARDVLARGCAIDLDPRSAPVGTCVQTLVARTGVIVVVRDDRAGEFLLLVRSSFAEYLAAWLVDAASGR